MTLVFPVPGGPWMMVMTFRELFDNMALTAVCWDPLSRLALSERLSQTADVNIGYLEALANHSSGHDIAPLSLLNQMFCSHGLSGVSRPCKRRSRLWPRAISAGVRASRPMPMIDVIFRPPILCSPNVANRPWGSTLPRAAKLPLSSSTVIRTC